MHPLSPNVSLHFVKVIFIQFDADQHCHQFLSRSFYLAFCETKYLVAVAKLGSITSAWPQGRRSLADRNFLLEIIPNPSPLANVLVFRSVSNLKKHKTWEAKTLSWTVETKRNQTEGNRMKSLVRDWLIKDLFRPDYLRDWILMSRCSISVQSLHWRFEDYEWVKKWDIEWNFDFQVHVILKGETKKRRKNGSPSMNADNFLSNRCKKSHFQLTW